MKLLILLEVFESVKIIDSTANVSFPSLYFTGRKHYQYRHDFQSKCFCISICFTLNNKREGEEIFTRGTDNIMAKIEKRAKTNNRIQKTPRQWNIYQKNRYQFYGISCQINVCLKCFARGWHIWISKCIINIKDLI